MGGMEALRRSHPSMIVGTDMCNDPSGNITCKGIPCVCLLT
jgi:hypothetical protein